MKKATKICILGLVILGIGVGVFFGAQLKYLPKYRTIVVVNYYTNWIRETGGWLILGGLLVLTIGGTTLAKNLIKIQRKTEMIG